MNKDRYEQAQNTTEKHHLHSPQKDQDHPTRAQKSTHNNTPQKEKTRSKTTP